MSKNDNNEEKKIILPPRLGKNPLSCVFEDCNGGKMNLKYKPEEGFEFDKLDLFQKDGKYYYQYKTLNETFEENINKSLYEELRKEKELFLSVLDCEFKDLDWIGNVCDCLIFYITMCSSALVVLLFAQIIDIVCNIFSSKIAIIIIFTDIFILFQIFLSVNCHSAYKIKEKQAIEIYQEFEQKVPKINHFNTREIYEKFDLKLELFNIYRQRKQKLCNSKGEKNEI